MRLLAENSDLLTLHPEFFPSQISNKNQRQWAHSLEKDEEKKAIDSASPRTVHNKSRVEGTKATRSQRPAEGQLPPAPA